MSTLSKITISLFAVAIAVIGFSTYNTPVHANAGGAPAGTAGDPAASGNTCATAGCHNDAAATPITEIITSTIPNTGYVAGTTYDMFVILKKTGISKFGFEVSAQDLSGNAVGTLATADTKTKLVGSSKYITHTATGTAATSDSILWQFKWTAPSGTVPDSVTFYGAFNASNSNSGTTGDQIFTSTSTFKKDTTSPSTPTTPTTPTGVDEYSGNASIAVYPNPTSNVININSGDVDVLAISIVNASGNTVINTTASSSIDISSLQNGKYFVRVTTNEGTVTKQVIKQ